MKTALLIFLALCFLFGTSSAVAFLGFVAGTAAATAVWLVWAWKAVGVNP